MKKYMVDYFIKKFSEIPDEEWGIREYVSYDDGRRCAIGHCGGPWSEESNTLRNLVQEFLGCSVTGINDGLKQHGNAGETPKERILNALELIKAGVRI